MSIIITSVPNLVAPAYNPFYYVVTSSNNTQPNFQYIFDIFTGTTGAGNAISRVILQPRPGAGNCIFSPARILESYVSYDLNIQNITAGTPNVHHVIDYSIAFGEQFGALSTGVTTYTGLTWSTGVTFNAVQQYAELPTWDYTNYNLGNSSSKFLTNQPRSGVLIKNATDRGTLSFLCKVSGGTTPFPPAPSAIIYGSYQTSGGSKFFNVTNYAVTASTPGRYVEHIPAGIWNINNIPQSLFTSGSGTPINILTDYQYVIGVFDPMSGSCSELLYYKIDQDCSKYQTVRFQFLNRLGGFDYVNFNLVSRKTINVKRNEFKKVLDYNYVVGERGRTILDIDAAHTYVATSDWLNQDQSNWIEELLTSNEVYTISDQGVATPVIIEEGSVEILKNINPDSRLINYTFNYSDAFKVDTQRG